ncbi:hypothetical protein DUGA6_58480 [Duganella sp. HH105]|nr:hypothetical protein DUGA6_58480 [Duganella sp. HH105]
MLPELFQADGAPRHHVADIEGRRYAVMCYPMGEHSASRGSLIALSTVEPLP